MIATKAAESIKQAEINELEYIKKRHGEQYNTPHEGYAVMAEEIEELFEALEGIRENSSKVWKSVKINILDDTAITLIRSRALAAAEEAIQVAAVCDKFLSGTVHY